MTEPMKTYISLEEILSLGFKRLADTDHYATGGLEASTYNFISEDGRLRLSQQWLGNYVLERMPQESTIYYGYIPTPQFLKEIIENTK